LILTVLLGLLVLSLLVVFHELGHFILARSLGVRVERFSIGFGPVILSRRRGEVEYAISAFPLGGYVKMGGEDPRQRENLRPGDFFAASWWRRVLISLGGPGANFVLGVILSILLLWVGVRIPDAPNRIGAVTAGSAADSLGLAGGDRIVSVNGAPTPSLQSVYHELGDPEKPGSVTLGIERDGAVRDVPLLRSRIVGVFQGLEFPVPAEIGEVVLRSPAYEAGLKVGDKIVAVNGEPVGDFRELQQKVVVNPGKRITLTVEREGRRFDVPITPYEDTTGGEKEGKIGVAARSSITYLVRRGFADGIVDGTGAALTTVWLTASGIVPLFTHVSNMSQIAGPVAIIQASGEAAKAGWDRLIDLAIRISIALMVFNLLPIPILDGGMVALSLLEGIRRRPLGERGLTVYQRIGLAVMGTLLIFVLINDPLRIFQRQSALGRTGNLAP
jgi:regulator of sigma E protease